MLNNRYNGFIRYHRSFSLAFIKITDIVIIITLFSYLFSYGDQVNRNQIIILICILLNFEFFASIHNLYSVPRGANFLLTIQNITSTWLLTVSFTLAFVYFTDRIGVVPNINILLLWFFVSPALLIIWHFLMTLILVGMRKIGRNSRKAAIAGVTHLGLDIAHIISKQSWMGFNLMGFFDDRMSKERHIAELDLMGSFNDMVAQAKAGNIDVIFITLPMCAEKRIKSIVDTLSDTSTVVYFIPDLFVFDLMGAKIEHFNGMPAVCVYDTPYNGIDGFSKRLLDFALSLIILAIIAVPMLLIAIGVKLSSPGPVFFIQRRYGFRGQEIKVWKFRTMRVCEDGAVVNQASRADSRITPFGQFLRKTSFDELPQFFNTLKGDMSIVGPRPHAVAHNEFYRGLIRGYMLRHNVKPGITGLAQIRGFRGETDTLKKMEDRIYSDLEYIQKWSIWLDLKIILFTLFKGFVHKNAY